jgi:hypothetical protein
VEECPGRSEEEDMGQKTGTAAILSIIGAIVCFILTFSGHVFSGFALAMIAIVLGIIGFFMAASPRVSGGIISIGGIVLGAIGIVLDILGMVGKILF